MVEHPRALTRNLSPAGLALDLHMDKASSPVRIAIPPGPSRARAASLAFARLQMHEEGSHSQTGASLVHHSQTAPGDTRFAIILQRKPAKKSGK